MRTHYTWKTWFGPDAPIQVRPWSNRNDRYEEHDHDFLEITLITEGEGMQRSAQGIHKISAGSLLILRPGAWHDYHDCRGLAGVDSCIAEGEIRRLVPVLFDDPYVSSLTMSKPCLPRRWGVWVTTISGSELDRCRRILPAITSLPQDATSLTERIGLFMQYMSILANSASNRTNITKSIGVHPAIQNIAQFLEDDLARAWTMEEICSLAEIEASTLTRRFRRSFGLPPMAWLSRRRAERAAQMLTEGNQSITEIGAEVGWDDSNYFARRFRAQYGISPSSYRDRFRV